MSHLNPSPNQTKTQSKRQNRSERNREERSKRRESESERRERGRCSQPHTTRRRRRSLAHNPQPISLARDHSTTAPQPSDHPTTATTKPPTQRRHHRERLAERAPIWWERFEFLEREVWVSWERVDETQSTTIHDPRLPSPSRLLSFLLISSHLWSFLPSTLLFSSSQSSINRSYQLFSWPTKEPFLLLLLTDGTMMSSWVFEVKILAKILQPIYIRLCVIRDLTPLLMMTFRGEKKFQWNLLKPLNRQWFQLLYSLKILHLLLGAWMNSWRFLSVGEVMANWFF